MDGESPSGEFLQMVKALSAHAGLTEPPSNFYVWSPQWDPRPAASIEADPANEIAKQVQTIKPALVIIDPLRVFWRYAESKAEEAVKMIQRQRELTRDHGTTWVTLHHRRKTNALNLVDLERDPQEWFQEAAGARALVNQTDSRIGIDRSNNAQADLLVSGFTRMIGRIPPIHITRVFDDNGSPLGYRPLEGKDHLSAKFQAALGSLPREFRYKDAHEKLGGNSHATTSEFLARAQSLQLVTSTGDHSSKRYQQVPSGVNGVSMPEAA